MAPLTWRVAKMVVKVDYAGIVNILAGREVVPEFLQHEVEPARLASWVEGQMDHKEDREKLRQELLAVAAELGEGGCMSE